MTNDPGWLADKKQLSRRAARSGQCPKCGQQILIGPDHDVCAAIAKVDIDPITRAQEEVAKKTSQATYDLVGRDLHFREREHINSPEARYPIHKEHQCPHERPKGVHLGQPIG